MEFGWIFGEKRVFQEDQFCKIRKKIYLCLPLDKV